MGVRADLQAARDVTGDTSLEHAAHFVLQRTMWRLIDAASVALVVVVAIVYPPAVLVVLLAAGVVNWTWRRELIVAVGPTAAVAIEKRALSRAVGPVFVVLGAGSAERVGDGRWRVAGQLVTADATQAAVLARIR